ncbi:hypothetical protein O181_089990 [Austropuccinia psidii MF-1]|uniref:Uncharacterized protein n=1 Tax=Austropuccinia psidii MF-1 TaxID=1389203 RepID=A0A9Q3IUA0_9BASI|nr:hypothetical protein [Austropuccinia psidii MF-1]
MVGSFSNLEESQHSCLPSQELNSMDVHPPSLPYFPLGTSKGIKSLRLQLSLKKKMNWKSLKYWTQSSREEDYGIWWNGKASVNNEKDPLGNQLKTSIIVLNLSRIFILYNLTSQDPILQELAHS